MEKTVWRVCAGRGQKRGGGEWEAGTRLLHFVEEGAKDQVSERHCGGAALPRRVRDTVSAAAGVGSSHLRYKHPMRYKRRELEFRHGFIARMPASIARTPPSTLRPGREEGLENPPPRRSHFTLQPS